MDDDTKPLDRRLDLVQERLRDDLVDEGGNRAPADEVEAVVADKAEALADAPVQDFVPLLVEHQAREELRHHGLNRTFPDEPQEPVDPGSDDADDTPAGRFGADPT